MLGGGGGQLCGTVVHAGFLGFRGPPGCSYTPPMSRRTSRYGAARPPRRWAVFSLAALAVLGVATWLAPTVLVLTGLRDRPLQALLAGVAGSVESRAATWTWLYGITYRDIVVRDATGRAVAIVPELVIDKGLLGLALDPRDLGTVRLAGVELLVEVRRGGSSLEDLLGPWLAGSEPAGAAPRTAPRGAPACEVEVIDGAIECIDLEREDAWRVSDLLVAGTLRSDGSLAGWTIAGRLRHAGQGGRMPATAPPQPDAAVTSPLELLRSPALAFPRSPRLDRTTIAANATAVLARDGGWSISSPDGPAAGANPAAGSRTIAIATHRLPLGFTSLLSTRFQASHLLDGLADIRLDIGLADSAGGLREIAGSLAVERLAVCRADTLAELVTIDRCEVPIDLVVNDGDVEVRTLAAKSPLFRGEASGRIRLPAGDSWRWADELVAEDFMIAADVDLAAAARALVGGLAVRPDVRVTGGRLEITASSRADGPDRVLEMRVAARDLAAVQSVVPDAAGGGGERQLRWNDPFAAWLRGRRPPGRTGRFRIEEARVTSASIELSAAGTAAESTVQWTIDLAKLRSEAGELLDLGGLALEGLARGRLEITGGGPRDPSLLRATAELADFACLVPGRPEWRDESITLEAEATGRFAGGATGITATGLTATGITATGLIDPFLVETAHAVVVAADDRLEATLTGGVLVDPVAVAIVGAAGVSPAPQAEAVAADCSLTGDLARWQSRLVVLVPRDAAAGITLGGRIEAAAAVAAREGAWQITRASTEIEKLSWTTAGRTQTEPRLVATAAGVVTPARGRVEISSAELLTSTLSLRTGGLVWQPRGEAAADVIAELRGRIQWQTDVGRFARWLLPPETAAAWPVSGRAWGTCELLDTPAGANLLVEATGSQLALARGGGKAAAGGSPLWAEPRAAVMIELTRQAAASGSSERLRVDRLAVESSTLALAAQGGVGDAASRRMLELEGTVSYDWEQLSRLLVPWTGGRVRLAGTGGRPFVFRTPLADSGGVPVTPTAAGPRPAALEAVRGLGLDTSIAWEAADVAGFALGPGEMPVRLLEGQLAFGPLDVAVSGGRLRGAPWISLVGGPRELVVPPGRILDRVAVGGPQGHAWITWLSPLLGRTTEASGVVSVDVAGARVPLAEPFAGELAGQVLFENFEVAPNPLMQPLVNLIVKLQSVIDPRFAFGDKAVLLRVRPEPVRVRLTGGRLWHEGLVMDSGQLVVKSGGSVAADGSLAMTVEVAFRGDLAGQTPVIAQLLRTPLSIPLSGTIERPQFDARTLEQILGRIVENTAQAVIGDGLGRGLEALFGNPQPSPGGQPLVLPPRPR
jgi:hypothetical protein